MGIKVEVEDGESFESALRRFNRKQIYEYKRWTKKRLRYYEKPSELRRKAEKMARIWQIKFGPNKGGSAKRRLHLYIGLPELFSRTGPNNTAGR